MHPETPSAFLIADKVDFEADFKGAKQRFENVRALTETICNPLETEDYGLQAMEDTSPPKWHLAHSTWFFETFLLVPYTKNYRVFNTRFHELFNSYYRSLGSPYPRARRGLISRPTVREVYAYRAHVDAALSELLAAPAGLQSPRLLEILEWGLQHEQQHQELLLMDIQYNLFANPLRPAYLSSVDPSPAAPDGTPLGWVDFLGGNRNLGADGGGFSFDNESPRHIVYLEPYALADRLATCEEYLAFMEDGGYDRHEFWLADGWDLRRKRGWEAPLYWEKREGRWRQYTLQGMQDVRPNDPVSHVSYYEADAFARWAGKRLPTEAEWENAVSQGTDGLWRPATEAANFLESGRLRPSPASEAPASVNGLRQVFGDLWEWTQSAYAPYPGFKPPRGALGEYNGKFMNNQRVLRGGSCVTPRSHIRPTYRNFFHPEDRWPFNGVRLCQESQI
jgi:ergothioneine biosynthesis protein EgtB